MDEQDLKKTLKHGSIAELIRLMRSGDLSPQQERRVVRKYVERNNALSVGNSLYAHGTHSPEGYGEEYRKYFMRSIIFLVLMTLPVVVGLFAIGDVEMSNFDSRQWVEFGAMVGVAILLGIPTMVYSLKARRILFLNTAEWMMKQ